MGLGFTLSLTIIASIRELIGSGKIFGIDVFGGGYEPMLLMILPAGGFITLGLLLGILNSVTAKSAMKKEA